MQNFNRLTETDQNDAVNNSGRKITERCREHVNTLPSPAQILVQTTMIALTQRSKYWFLFHHVVLLLCPGHGLSLPDVPRVPDPHTRPAAGEAPAAQDLPAPAGPALTTDRLGREETGEVGPGQVLPGVVAQVGQQPLVPSLATVQADLVTEHHLED